VDELRILLVGMMGAGKTTVGEALGAATGWPYHDNDRLVRDATGREPAEIRATDGEDILHLAEGDALDRALQLAPPAIVGVAAAAVQDPAAREALREGGHVVWLRARPETLIARIGSGAGRRAEAADGDWLRRAARDRAPLYAAVAHRIVDVDEAAPDAVVASILAGLPSSAG
jgi:shikimate kinase